MTFRVFSKKVGLYTNDVSWPSNQRSVSDWYLDTNGRIVEAVFFGANEPVLVIHDGRGFVIEPFTGYHDSAGKKIYLGDILEMVVFETKYQVIWRDGEFILKDLTSHHVDLSMKNCSHHTITGNIHSVTFDDEI